MTFNNPQLSTTEPAFMSNEKFNRSRPRGLHKSLGDCCYSLANLALIIASLVGLVFTVKFFYDDPLYDYGEHLLSLRFYRQLIYLLVVFCLILLVPLFNAISVCCLTGQRKAGPMMSTKLIYQVLLGLMAFVALAFVAPYIRSASVTTQLAHELRRHMKFRYEQDFSYVLIDRIQEEYNCCDEPWYRANFRDLIPASCYVPDGKYINLVKANCADVIGEVVANRCIVLSACLVAILASLGILLAIDLIQLLTESSRGGRNYNVGAREAKLGSVKTNEEEEEESSNSSIIRAGKRFRSAATKDEEEEDRDEPLLSGLQDRPRSSTPMMSNSIDQDPYNSRLVYQPTTSPILAKTKILPGLRGRPQSPIFVGADSDGANQAALSVPPKSPSKGVLKKSPASSIQPIDSDEDDHHSRQSDDAGLCETLNRTRQGFMQQPTPAGSRTSRDSPTRRSATSVRFA